MKNYQKILDDILKDITPKKGEKERLENLSKKALGIARIEASRYGAKAILAGSITRDTWLPDKNEFDIFVLFPESLPLKKLEEYGLKIGKSVIKKLKGKYRIEYAQHPYVSGLVDRTDIDIVPCYEVTSPDRLKSAVDRTPFHVKYIEQKLPLKLSGDVRLLKHFCKANEIYGADAKTEGFSGYVCELLILKYGSFVDALKAVERWNPGEVIDLENFYSKDVYRDLRRKFNGEALILIDPIDKDRNAGAAVSARSFYILKKIAGEFLKRPNEKLFFEKEYKSITEHELITYQMNRRTELILVKFKPPDMVPDILWPQLRRFSDRLQSILEETRYEFKVLRKGEYTNERDLAVVLLEMEVSKLPKIQKRIGPKIFDFDDSERFLKKYSKPYNGPFIEKNYWVVEIKRKFLAGRDKLVDSLKKNVKNLKDKGIPNYIAEQNKTFEIISDNEGIMKLVKKDSGFGVFLRKYFEKESLI